MGKLPIDPPTLTVPPEADGLAVADRDGVWLGAAWLVVVSPAEHAASDRAAAQVTAVSAAQR